MIQKINVGESSQELIAILKQFNVAYNLFVAYMNKHYGINRGNQCEFEEEFYDKWCDVTSVVDNLLSENMLFEMRETNFTSI